MSRPLAPPQEWTKPAHGTLFVYIATGEGQKNAHSEGRRMDGLMADTTLTYEQIERIIDERDKRLESKLLDMIRAELAPLRSTIDGKASHEEIATQTRSFQHQLDEMRVTLARSNETAARIEGLLDGLKSVHGDRVDTATKRIDELEDRLNIYTAASAGLSEAFSLMRRDLYGGDGGSNGLQQTITAFGLQLTSIAENQNRAINAALEPLTERLGGLEATFIGIERFVNERKRLESLAWNTGKRLVAWLTSRPQSARWSAVIVAGIAVGGWLAGEPVGQIAEQLIRRVLGLP